MTVLQIIQQYHVALFGGLKVTLRLCLIAWIVGLIGGTGYGAVAARWPRSIGRVFRALAIMFSGLPILVLFFWLHYPAQQLLGVVVDPFYTAAVALSTINLFAVSEAVREALEHFRQEFVTVARVCGMSPRKILLHVQLPIVLRQVAPTLLMIEVNVLQASLFASLISVDEIFRVAQQINSQIYSPVQVYSTLAVFFILICGSLNFVAWALRRQFERDLSET